MYQLLILDGSQMLDGSLCPVYKTDGLNLNVLKLFEFSQHWYMCNVSFINGFRRHILFNFVKIGTL